MNTNDALQFLKNNQPLPPTRIIDDQLIDKYDQVRRYFEVNIVDDAVPLLIGAIGEGDGHGVYQMLETTLLKYPKTIVVDAVKNGLESRYQSVRYWSAQIAANYDDEALIDGLVELCKSGDVDEQIAALTALEVNSGSDVKVRLSQITPSTLCDEARGILKDILG